MCLYSLQLLKRYKFYQPSELDQELGDSATRHYVRFSHGGQFMLIGRADMTSLSSRSPCVSMTSQYGGTGRFKKGGLVARGPEYETDPAEIKFGVITGHGIQVHSRESEQIPSRLKQYTTTTTTTTTRTDRPKTTANPHRREDSKPCRPLTAGTVSVSKKQLENNAPVETGVLHVQLEVTHIDIDKCEGETWIRTYRRKILKLYTIVLRDDRSLLERLNLRTRDQGLTGVDFVKVTLASIVLHAKLNAPSSIVQLEESIRRRTFTDLVNDVIVTRALLDELNVAGLRFVARVDPEDLERCKRDIEVVHSTNRSTNDTSAQREHVIPDTTMVNDPDVSGQGVQSKRTIQPSSGRFQLLSDIHISFTKQFGDVTTRYNMFEDNIDHFLMTLTIIKRPEVEFFACLGDVITCYDYLKLRETIAKNVRSDLIKEYLAIVNVLRLKVDEVIKRLKKAKMLLRREDAILAHLQNTLDAYIKTSLCFSPDFPFPDIDMKTSIHLSIIDRELFSRLINYLPWLMNKIREINILAEST